MTYTKTTFINGQAPAVSAEELNKMGQGIEDAFIEISNLVAINDSYMNVLLSSTDNSKKIATTAGVDKTYHTFSFTRIKGYEKMKVKLDSIFNGGFGASGTLKLYVNNALKYQGGGIDPLMVELSGYPLNSLITVRLDVNTPQDYSEVYAYHSYYTYNVFDVI